jgi:hypothetical protein
MAHGTTRRPGALTLALGVVSELAVLGAALVAWPFLSLDDRHGWTARGRGHRAMDELRRAPAVRVAEAGHEGRVILEGTLEAAGPLVHVPLVGRTALAWAAWAIDGGEIRLIDGAVAAMDLVDATGRARLDLVGARVPYGLGERHSVREAPEAWRERSGASVDEWKLSWVSPGARARASGRLARREARAAPYRDGVADCTLGPGDDGVPVLLG